MPAKPTDHPNLTSAELSRGLTFAMGMAPLVEHVRHVVLMGSKEQMRRIHAAWIVATVQHMKTLRDCSEG